MPPRSDWEILEFTVSVFLLWNGAPRTGPMYPHQIGQYKDVSWPPYSFRLFEVRACASPVRLEAPCAVPV